MIERETYHFRYETDTEEINLFFEKPSNINIWTFQDMCKKFANVVGFQLNEINLIFSPQEQICDEN